MHVACGPPERQPTATATLMPFICIWYLPEYKEGNEKNTKHITGCVLEQIFQPWDTDHISSNVPGSLKVKVEKNPEGKIGCEARGQQSWEIISISHGRDIDVP